MVTARALARKPSPVVAWIPAMASSAAHHSALAASPFLVADVAIVPVVQAAVEARQLGGERDETGIGSGGIVRPGSRGNDGQRARPGGQVPQHGRPQPLIPRVPFVRIQQVRSPRHQRHGGGLCG